MDEVSEWASVDICRENLGLNSDRNVSSYNALRAGFKISHHKSASVVNFVCMYISLQIWPKENRFCLPFRQDVWSASRCYV